MKYYTVSTGYGNVRSGEHDWVWKPSHPRPAGKFGCVLLHGAGNPQGYLDAYSAPGSAIIAGTLARAGIPCVAAEMSGNAWANDNAMADISAAISLLAAQTGVPSSKVVLVGGSMGGATAIRFAMDNPTKVAALAGVIPLTNLKKWYDTNWGGTRAEIAAAWGVTYPAAFPSGGDLQARAAELTVPTTLYYSATDALIDPADTTAFATAAGVPAINIGNHGHTDTTMFDLYSYGSGGLSHLLNFLQANGA